MTIAELRPKVHSLSMKDWDRRLFDQLIPLPDGTSYNSYLIQGSEKIALIDSADPRKQDEFLADLQQLKVSRIDYVITNHAEPDHSGSIPVVLEKFPDAQAVATEKGKAMLVDLLLIPADRFLTVKDGDTLSLGDRTLEFIKAPWVHWPETMFTYLQEDKILFPCDFLGNHIATSDVFATDEGRVYLAAKRYYAEIMMPFRTMIKKHLKRLDDFDIELIATSHGAVYNNPDFILNAYKDWTSDAVKNEVIIPYVSMYGSTESMVQYLTEILIKNGVTVKPFNLAVTDIGELAMALVDAATIVIGSPTVLVGPHPAVVYAAYLANAIRPKAKFASVVGSYGWQGKMVEQLMGMLGNLKVEVIDPVLVKGKPVDQTFRELNHLADAIITKHREAGLITTN
ncbi:MAG: FprA family A-type flavoprotein [Candidatus Hodarchaeales archaeon]|jgi:flavorubredoxin